MLTNKLEVGAPDAVLGDEVVSVRGTTWQMVLNEILQRIRKHDYPAGSLIPTELQLAAELGCARATVNRAMTELAQRGVVIRRRKVGTRVAEHTDAVAPLSHTLRHRVEQSGRSYRHELLSRQTAPANAEVARDLMLPPDSDVVEIRSLIWADRTRWAHEQCWIRPATAEMIPSSETQDISAYEWMMEHLDPDRVEALVSAATARTIGSDAAMQMPPDAPLLVFSTLLWLGPDPVAFVTHSMDSAFHLQQGS